MRSLIASIVLLMLAGCASPVITPREYLDEETAATITVVAEPWIFTGEQFDVALTERDYLNVFAIDINRMGDHRQYLAVLQSLPPVGGPETAAPILELQGAGQTVVLQPTSESARKLGIAKPLAPSYSLAARWLYFPVSKETLSTVVRSRDLQAALVSGDNRSAYVRWRDGSEEITALTSVLP